MQPFRQGIAATTLTFALLGTPLLMAAESGTEAPTADPAEIVVRINEVAIPRAELERNIRALSERSGLTAPLTPEQRDMVEKAAMENLIRSELLYQLAKEQEVPDLAQRVDEQLAVVKSRSESEAAWQEALADKGITEEGLREQLARGLLISAYVENALVSKIEISDAQARSFYDEHADSFQKPESMRASHILIGVEEGASAEAKAQAREKADAILGQVKSGADFAELAKSESSCPSAAQGGDLGEFTRGQMVAPFEEAAFGLESGEVSEVVETQFGYHVIKATGKNAAGAVPFEEVEGRIREHLKTQAVQQELLAKIEALRGQSKIEILGTQP